MSDSTVNLPDDPIEREIKTLLRENPDVEFRVHGGDRDNPFAGMDAYTKGLLLDDLKRMLGLDGSP